MFKIAKVFATLSAVEFHQFFVAAEPVVQDDVAAQMAAMQAELAKAKADAAAAAAQAAQHQADIARQAQEHQDQLDTHRAAVADAQKAAQNSASSAEMLTNLAMSGAALSSGVPALNSIPGAEHVTGLVGDKMGSLGNGMAKFGDFQAQALNAGVEINPTKILSGLSGLMPDFSSTNSETVTGAPAYDSATGTYSAEPVAESDYSITQAATDGLKTVAGVAVAAPKHLMNAHAVAKTASTHYNLLKKGQVQHVSLDNSLVKGLVGEEDAKGLHDAFHYERKVIEEQGVKGVMQQFRENVFDPQNLPLADYAHGIHDSMAAYGINFDETRVNDAIAGFKKIDVDAVVEKATDKVRKEEYVQKALSKGFETAEATAINLGKGAVQGANKLWDRVSGKTAKEEAERKRHLRRALHARNHHFMNLNNLLHDTWAHIFMHLMMLFMLVCIMLVFFKKSRKHLKRRNRQMI